uniref:Ig-like domain-containing protein n=1 Tax=Anabas testudineus TaxID=64144 RepID=A0A3Q1I1S3_ANATE
ASKQMKFTLKSPGGKWTANVPAVIPALQGSCVVIPCTYNYPKPKSKKILNRWKGFWKKGNKIMSTNLRKWKLPKEYKRRTKFLGNLKWHNCTMMLDGIRKTDVGPFYFRIEMPQYKSFSYINNTVSLLVMSEPDAPTVSAVVNNKVTASCSVSHSCPYIPPRFSWSRPGIVRKRSKKLNAWNWETVSTLTFQPLSTDFNKTLECTVLYSGGKQAKTLLLFAQLDSVGQKDHMSAL